MDFAANPNLPDKPVSLVIADGRISEEAQKRLANLNVSLLRLQPHRSLYTAVNSHPDMQLHHIGGEMIVYAPGTDPVLLDILSKYGFKLLKGESVLSPSYPADIAYNAARVGNKYFHNLKYTDAIIRRQLEKLDVEPVHVKQGYAKCSILAVNENSIITSDTGIAKAAEKKGLDVLNIATERSIKLPELNYGFIGGTGGMIGKTTLAVNGRIASLDCHDALLSFLSNKNIIIKELTDEIVTDIGSIIPLFHHTIHNPM